MHVVYEAENLIDAHLVKGLLEQSGIGVYVRGEFLTGAIGGLPTGGLVAVCVDEVDVPAANGVLAQWRADRREDGPETTGEGGWDSIVVPT